MATIIHIHDHRSDGTVVTRDFNPAEHLRGGRGQFGAGEGKPFQHGEHPRNGGGVFTQGSHPGERSEKQKRERTDLVSNQDAAPFEEAKHARNAGKFATSQGAGAAPAQLSTKELFAAKNPGASAAAKENTVEIEVGGQPVKVTLSASSKAAGEKMVQVDAKKFDEMFKKDSNSYVGEGGKGGIGKRYEGVKQYISEKGAMEASSVHVKPNGMLTFINGRHRYAALRDQGVKSIPIAMDKEAIKNAKAAGLIDKE